MARGQNEEATVYLKQALEKANKLEVKSLVASILRNQASISRSNGDNEKAMFQLSDAIDLAEETNDKRLFCTLTLDIANVYSTDENYPEAKRHCEEALAAAKDAGLREQERQAQETLSNPVSYTHLRAHET